MNDVAEGVGLLDEERMAEPTLRLVDHYVVPMGDNQVQIRTATQKAMLSGRLVSHVLPKLLPLLDGSRTREAVIAEAGEERIYIETCLNLLQQKDLLRPIMPGTEEATSADTTSELYKYLSRREAAGQAYAELTHAHVTVVCAARLRHSVVDAVARLGVKKISSVNETSSLPDKMASGWAEPGAAPMPELVRRDVVALCTTTRAWAELLDDTPDMIVVCLDGPVVFHPWLEALNEFAIERNIPWTVCALIDDEEIHMGPTMRPGVTACYKCFEMRLKSNLANLGAYQALERFVHAGGRAAGFGSLTATAEIAGGLVALEVMRTLHPTDVALTSGRQFVFNTATFAQGFHPVLKLPRCPACSPSRQLPRQRVWA